MKWVFGSLVVVLIVLCAGVGAAQNLPPGRYFGQTPPGFVPEVFAPGIISLSNRYEFHLTFSPNLDECVFGVTNAAWSGFNLWFTKMGSDSTWIDPIPAPFQGSGDGLYPAYAADGDDIFFVSSRPSYPPTKIWHSSREGTGWSTPVALAEPIYSGANEWGGTLTADGVFYFCSNRAGGLGGGDIYRAMPVEGGWTDVENLGPTVNTPQLEGTPCVARDGSYLIFESQRPGGYGLSDLYITRNENGVWTTPTNLGPTINTAKFEDGAFISPDGKYLFFNRRDSFITTVQTEIWWVDARAALDPEQSGVKDPGGPDGSRVLLCSQPNPFGLGTTIRYSTPSSGFVAIKVYDLLGREVQSLVNESREVGTWTVDFDPPRDDRPSGVYFCSLQVGDQRLTTMRMVSLR